MMVIGDGCCQSLKLEVAGDPRVIVIRESFHVLHGTAGRSFFYVPWVMAHSQLQFVQKDQQNKEFVC